MPAEGGLHLVSRCQRAEPGLGSPSANAARRASRLALLSLELTGLPQMPLFKGEAGN